MNRKRSASIYSAVNTLLVLPQAVVLACLSAMVHAHGVDMDDSYHDLESIHVFGRKPMLGEAISASEGYVDQDAIEVRPLLRTGEVLELVPGMVVTQHSGSGKANQYFLRGFNLDHGTDFAVLVDEMPVNMRSHGHGQGYTDLNFLIPEAIQSLEYQKGSYDASVGDFSSSGNAAFTTASRLDNGLAKITLGQDAYQRGLLMDSVNTGTGDFFYALEKQGYDGPWTDVSEDIDKTNVWLKYHQPLAGGDWSISLMGYDNQWNSADQIPERAVASGQIDELGSLDDTVGGKSDRYSINSQWQSANLSLSAYAIRYNMNLWSNFTYYLDDSDNGDQFEQVDHRWIYGGQIEYRQQSELAGVVASTRIGADYQLDDIDEVGLYHTTERQRLGTIRSDAVTQQSLGLFADTTLYWNEQWRTMIGVRYDYFDFDVDSRVDVNQNGVDLSANSGTADDTNLSLKSSLVYAPDQNREIYLSIGQGLHSNDTRGTTIQVDPADGSDVDAVDPLVDSIGYELGVRGLIAERLNASLVLWQLDLDSELLFVGDAGNTEATRSSRRQGIEMTGYLNLTEAWNADLEYAYTRARFRDSSDDGDYIPGAPESVAQAGLTYIGATPSAQPWSGSLRMRYIGPRALLEDNSERAGSNLVLNAATQLELQNWQFGLEVLNLLDSDDHDIDYWYESQLAGESEAQEGLHYHVMEPRTVRMSAALMF
ncbi:TonB-dependent receptor [Oceanobacter sp. 5_MG-2023]|uniref:TonB-dependent receptor n=1 Tax=Oceanobacter sp. 5_MG-2023 TaxID=3062645 RepID=UPI0026E3D788|nr:TonB-dependent receptor [Oceanobacter sp. 5_MG-2023]MDO6683481.1 TonB-dependent receptor [Oceanobacter sp. 5_MG-2023]